MRTRLIAVALLLASASLPAQVDPQRFGTKYLTGRIGLKPFDSGITIAADRIIVTTSKKKNGLYVEAFSIPIASVVSAEVTRDRQEVALGFLSGPGDSMTVNVEYVTIVTESATGAESLVFQVTQLEGAGIVAKINFAVKKAKEAQGQP